MAVDSGILYVVATPIGNLDDISPRAREILASVELIAAEDTRRTGRLLTHFGINTRLLSCHEHNESKRVPQIIERLQAGADIALVSDAGTPLLSDPGYRLVAAAREHGLPISPVPGCSAVVAALSVAGLPADRFRFEAFLPAPRASRRKRLAELSRATETLVIFESVHRIRDTLADLAELFGSDRPAAVARELTKLNETVYRGTLAEVITAIRTDAGSSKGELTVIVAGCSTPAEPQALELERVLDILLEDHSATRAAAIAARITGVSRRAAYRIAVLRRQLAGGEKNR